jgi:hypothetical protein
MSQRVYKALAANAEARLKLWRDYHAGKISSHALQARTLKLEARRQALAHPAAQPAYNRGDWIASKWGERVQVERHFLSDGHPRTRAAPARAGTCAARTSARASGSRGAAALPRLDPTRRHDDQATDRALADARGRLRERPQELDAPLRRERHRARRGRRGVGQRRRRPSRLTRLVHPLVVVRISRAVNRQTAAA